MFGWVKNKIQETLLTRDFNRTHTDLKKDPLMCLDIKSIKIKYPNKFIELRDIINSHDPIGLIKSGAPTDEYEPEVKTIIVQLDDKQNGNEVLDLIYKEFEKWFGDAGNKENYIELAEDIFIWKKQ